MLAKNRFSFTLTMHLNAVLWLVPHVKRTVESKTERFIRNLEPATKIIMIIY